MVASPALRAAARRRCPGDQDDAALLVQARSQDDGLQDAEGLHRLGELADVADLSAQVPGMIPDRIQSDFLDSSACRGHGASSRDSLPSGEGTSYVPLGRGRAGAEALSPEGRKRAQRAAQRLDRRSRSGGFRR